MQHSPHLSIKPIAPDDADLGYCQERAHSAATNPAATDIRGERRSFKPRLLSTPPTPPSTPATKSILDYQAQYTLANPNMFELTRHKLERAAQGQLSGRRGAGGLRELVLLSNVLGSVLPSSDVIPPTDPTLVLSGRNAPSESDAQRETEIELERRRKLDEERWLDGVLEEMLEEDEDGADADVYVSLSIRDHSHRTVGDSGFLEADELGGESFSRPLSQIAEESELLPEDTAAGSPNKSVVGATRPLPMSSCRKHGLLPSTPDELDRSPPFFPPSLTPDSSPPGHGPANEMLSTSVDSVATELADSWIMDDLPVHRLDLAALDLSSCRSSSFKLNPLVSADEQNARWVQSPLDLAVRKPVTSILTTLDAQGSRRILRTLPVPRYNQALTVETRQFSPIEGCHQPMPEY
ncbi:hypothetical protein OIO90_005724 [Microbotryomycetes sp. JL221]|nr:hypothetical protein OIO90_005724 [Microbotryomycetes sp. JL221]